MTEVVTSAVPTWACNSYEKDDIINDRLVHCSNNNVAAAYKETDQWKNDPLTRILPNQGGREQRKMRRQSKNKSKLKFRRNKNSKFSRRKRSSK